MNENRSPIVRPALNVISLCYAALCSRFAVRSVAVNRLTLRRPQGGGYSLTAVIAATLVLTAQTTQAGSATWDSNPTSDWNTPANWTPNTVPNGPTNIATFGFSNTIAVSISASTDVNEIVFKAGASAFTITSGQFFTLNISGAGISNNSGMTQNFVADTDASGRFGILRFENSAIVGSSISFTNNGGVVSGGAGGNTSFAGTSSAGNGTFTNNGALVSDAGGGITGFFETSTGGNGTFTGDGGAVSGGAGGDTIFVGTSTAGNGTFINNGGTINGAFGSATGFNDNSTAGDGLFTINGGTGANNNGGRAEFFAASTAGNATLIANAGTNGGHGGTIFFFEDSTGGTARIEVFGNGNLDISAHYAPGVSVGSIQGSGVLTLGFNNLTVGSNNLSTTFSGVVQDGGGTGGTLTKIGSGTLRLSSGNPYTGGAIIEAGRLLANNSSGSGTGPGAVMVSNGGSVLGGTGTISGPVTVNTGAALLGGNATTASGSLKVAHNVTLSAGSIIQLVLGASGTHSTLTRTGGTWSFAPNQKFTFLDLGAQPGVYNNIITGLAADPGGVASWTITNAGFTGTFSYDGAGNIDLNLTAASGPVLQLTAAVSRKTHGAGTFDIPLPLTGEPGVECRNSGGNHTLVFTFSNNVVSGNASVTTGIGTVAGTPTFAAKTMSVSLAGVANVQKIIVTLSNVRDNLSQVLPDKTVSVNILMGDTSGNKAVNASDVAQTKGQSGAQISGTNFRTDVTVSGAINASDVAVVKSRSGTGVP